MRHTETALLWIADLLRELKVPYEIHGGLAAIGYGAKRELADIDLNIRLEDFERVAERVRPYLTFGPDWYRSDLWECYMMTLVYAGQEIDIGALGRIKYRVKATGAWHELPDRLDNVRMLRIAGLMLPVVNEAELYIHKQEIDRGVDRKDVRDMSEQLSDTD